MSDGPKLDLPSLLLPFELVPGLWISVTWIVCDLRGDVVREEGRVETADSEGDFAGGLGRWAECSSLESPKEEKAVAARLAGGRGRGRLLLLVDSVCDVSETEPLLVGQRAGSEKSFLAGSDSGSSVIVASEPSFFRMNQSPEGFTLIVRVSFLSMFPM